MQQYARALPLAGMVVILALVVILLMGRDGGSPSSGAAPLPTACDNFAKASELFARSGSAHALEMTGNQVFTRDADQASKQVLMDLMESCDAERGAR